MRWPWRREPDGEAARATKAEADKALVEARVQGLRVNAAVSLANLLSRQADQLSRDVERVLHLRGMT